MCKAERVPSSDLESPGPSRLVLGAKTIFDQNAETPFGFVTTEHAARQVISSLTAGTEVDPKRLLDMLTAQAHLSDESLVEIGAVGGCVSEGERQKEQAALIIQYEMEAFYPEVIREEEARFMRIRPEEKWIGAADRVEIVNRIVRDREFIGLPRFFRVPQERKRRRSFT